MGREPKLSSEQVREVAERIRRGSSVKREAVRVGLYHASVRRALRRVLGREAHRDLIRESEAKRRGLVLDEENDTTTQEAV